MGGARRLQRARRDGGVLELPVTSLVRDVVLGPQPADDADGLGEPAHAFRHGNAVDGVLLRPVAEPDAEQELAAADDVHEGADLGQLDRVVQRQQRDVGPEPQPLGVGGEALQQGQLREEVEARRDVMLAGPDRIEAERADQAHLLQRLGQAAGGIVAGRVLRVQVDAELHGVRPPPVMLRPGWRPKSRIARRMPAGLGCDFNCLQLPAPAGPDLLRLLLFNAPRSPANVVCRMGRRLIYVRLTSTWHDLPAPSEHAQAAQPGDGWNGIPGHSGRLHRLAHGHECAQGGGVAATPADEPPGAAEPAAG